MQLCRQALSGLGLQHRLLKAAMDFARDHGVRMLEAYPVDKTERSHDEFMFFGSRSLYERAGFREVVRRSPTRVVMRRALRPRRGDEPRARHATIRWYWCGGLAIFNGWGLPRLEGWPGLGDGAVTRPLRSLVRLVPTLACAGGRRRHR